jgi:hypothetical protein
MTTIASPLGLVIVMKVLLNVALMCAKQTVSLSTRLRSLGFSFGLFFFVKTWIADLPCNGKLDPMYSQRADAEEHNIHYRC